MECIPLNIVGVSVKMNIIHKKLDPQPNLSSASKRGSVDFVLSISLSWSVIMFFSFLWESNRNKRFSNYLERRLINLILFSVLIFHFLISREISLINQESFIFHCILYTNLHIFFITNIFSLTTLLQSSFNYFHLINKFENNQ